MERVVFAHKEPELVAALDIDSWEVEIAEVVQRVAFEVVVDEDVEALPVLGQRVEGQLAVAVESLVDVAAASKQRVELSQPAFGA